MKAFLQFHHIKLTTNKWGNQLFDEFPHSWDSGFRDIRRYPLIHRDLSIIIFPQSKHFPKRRLPFYPGLPLLANRLLNKSSLVMQLCYWKPLLVMKDTFGRCLKGIKSPPWGRMSVLSDLNFFLKEKLRQKRFRVCFCLNISRANAPDSPDPEIRRIWKLNKIS